MVMRRLSEADHKLVTEAVARAERESDGEIVPIVAARSDAYHDVGLHYSVLAMLVVPAMLAVLPRSWLDRAAATLFGWNAEPGLGTLMLTMFVLLAAAFLVVRLLLSFMPLRLALTPGRTKTRRVHRRAVELFRAGCELKTRGRTGVLVYLSLAERRAEIVADQAIAEKVEGEVWGEAMAMLVDEVKAGRPGTGLARAVDRIGTILAGILPPTGANPNELPDRVVEL
jgi:putative membrane protein